MIFKGLSDLLKEKSGNLLEITSKNARSLISQARKNAFISTLGIAALYAASYLPSFTLGYGTGKINNYDYVKPAISAEEKEIFSQLHGNPEAVQDWINTNVAYTDDHEQFDGIFCSPDVDYCEIWAPAAYLLRAKKEDCDGVLLFAHYTLRSGMGLLLLDDDANGPDHAIYLYRNEQGLYGVISINESEFRPAKYKTVDEIANELAAGTEFDRYKEMYLPENETILLYAFDWDAKYGPTKELNKQPEQENQAK